MKLGKAAMINNTETEHLRCAHPRLSVLLSVLFNCMMIHGRVPSMFGIGVIVPLIIKFATKQINNFYSKARNMSTGHESSIKTALTSALRIQIQNN